MAGKNLKEWELHPGHSEELETILSGDPWGVEGRLGMPARRPRGSLGVHKGKKDFHYFW